MDRVARLAGHLAPDHRVGVLDAGPDLQPPLQTLARAQHRPKAPGTSLQGAQELVGQPTAAAGGRTVAVLGAAGGIGQPLSLLLKL